MQMTTDLKAQALEWIAPREWVIEARSRLMDNCGMPVSFPREYLVADDLPEPLRSEVLKHLSH